MFLFSFFFFLFNFQRLTPSQVVTGEVVGVVVRGRLTTEHRRRPGAIIGPDRRDQDPMVGEYRRVVRTSALNEESSRRKSTA